jgi:hypothetical protein
MEKQLKEKIRSVVREGFISELSKNDIHVKEIMKFYDKGTYSTKKAVSIFVSGKTNASRNQILDDLGDMGYNDAWEVMDHFKLKIESVNESLITEKQFKGLDGIAPTTPLTKITKDQKLKIIKGVGNIIDFIVPKGVSRNFWQVIGTGKIKKNLSGEYYLEGKVINSPMFKSIDNLINGVKWDSMEEKRRFNESVNENTLNEGFGDSIKKIRNLAIKMASTKYDRAKSHLNLDKIASADDFDSKDAMNKATAALLQQKNLDEDLKSAINKIAVKLGTGATMLGVITALVSVSGWIQYLNSTFTRWYYSEIQKLAEPQVMDIMQSMGKAGQAEGSIWGKLGMYAFFIFFTIAVISLVAARMTQKPKNEADVVPGGLAKGLSLNDIAEKHGVSVDIMVAEFKKGIAVEMEHTTDREVAKEITLDHLFEDPKYYDKLAKVEEYVDKKGVERVAAALPQTEEEPIKECKICNSK